MTTTEQRVSAKDPRPYRTPQLMVYGDIRELTLATAAANVTNDNPMFPRLMT